MYEKNKLFSAFETFGRSFLLPVSVLPGAGMLLGIGNALTNTTTLSMYPFLQNEVLQFSMQLFIALGNVAFGNLPVIFAVGVSVGLAKQEKGSAALSGLLGFLTLHIMLNLFLTQTGMLTVTTGLEAVEAKKVLVQSMQTSVLGIQTMDLGVFGGIITGLFVYAVHKRSNGIQLPEMLDFFSGPRLVPLLTLVGMSVVAGALFFVWPFIHAGISVVSLAIIRSGYVGTFFYGVSERLLLPFGLHHGLNWPVYTTDIGGTWDICNQPVSGTVNAYIASLSCPSIDVIDPNLARFNSGKFLYFMFGLPGAALAMYQCADKAQRRQASSLLIAAAGSAFITGITEPIEFTFLFGAPLLYGAHAFLAGVATFSMHVLGAAVATPIGHGLINFMIYGVIQGFKTKWYIIALAGPVCFGVYYVVFKFLIRRYDLKTPGREDVVAQVGVTQAIGEQATPLLGATQQAEARSDGASVAGATRDASITQEAMRTTALALITAHGGSGNIAAVDACITRLRINVKDSTLVDKGVITETLAAQAVIEAQGQIQSVYGAKANMLKMEIEEILNKGE